jgi:hypothetical protein
MLRRDRARRRECPLLDRPDLQHATKVADDQIYGISTFIPTAQLFVALSVWNHARSGLAIERSAE